MNDKDTIPVGLAILLFSVLGLLILGAVVFAGINAFRLIRGDRDDATVPVVGETVLLEDGDEQPELYTGARPLTLLDAYGNEIGEEFIVPPPLPEDKPLPTPVPTPEPTPAPAPRVVAARPQPTPAPEPLPPVSCPTCVAVGLVTCQSCNGIGGGRGRPFVPDLPHEVREVSGQDDIWWCSGCAGTGTVTCRTCDGAGLVVPPSAG